MFTEDINAFFNAAEFAQVATIGGADVRVIFENASADPFGSVVDATQPICWAPTASVASVVQGSSILLGGTTYTVERVTHDGTGVSRIVMYQA